MADHATGSPTRPSLLRRLRAADDQLAWQTFLDVYGPLIYRSARRRGLQDADAAEVMQDVLLRVCKAIRGFEYHPECGRFRDWLGTVTRNVVGTFFRRQAGTARASGDEDAEEALASIAAPPQDTQWTEEFNRHLLQTALARTRGHFEEPTWRAFELVWRDDRPPAEVARELGQTLNWVYLAKSRVLKRLEEELRELAEDMPLLLR